MLAVSIPIILLGAWAARRSAPWRALSLVIELARRGPKRRPWSLEQLTAARLKPLPFDDINGDDFSPDSDAAWIQFRDAAVAPMVHALLCLTYLFDIWRFLPALYALPLLATHTYRIKRSMEVERLEATRGKPVVSHLLAVLRTGGRVAGKATWILELRYVVGRTAKLVRWLLRTKSPEDGSTALEERCIAPFERLNNLLIARFTSGVELFEGNCDLLGLAGLLLVYVAHIANCRCACMIVM